MEKSSDSAPLNNFDSLSDAVSLLPNFFVWHMYNFKGLSFPGAALSAFPSHQKSCFQAVTVRLIRLRPAGLLLGISSKQNIFSCAYF